MGDQHTSACWVSTTRHHPGQRRGLSNVISTFRVAGVCRHLRYRDLLGTADRLPSGHRHRIIAASGWMLAMMHLDDTTPTIDDLKVAIASCKLSIGIGIIATIAGLTVITGLAFLTSVLCLKP
jgi:hypothetical protein